MLPPLPPPPRSIASVDPAVYDWLKRVHFLVGQATATFQGDASGNIGGNAAGTASNITGILASANINTNSQVNSTNFCTVDSIDNGVDATVRVYGAGGVGSSWTRQAGDVTYGPYASASLPGYAYSTDFYVAYDPAAAEFIVSADFPDVLPDGLIFCGILTTVAAGGVGGTSGGGGSTGTRRGSFAVVP